MIFLDDILDKRFSDEIYFDLLNGPWYANNMANRYTYPYGEKGSHLLLGTTIYRPLSEYFSDTNLERKISVKFINIFNHLCFKLNKKLSLKSIDANLQFYGQDGTFHADGDQEDEVFILLLCNEIFDNDIGGEFINQTVGKTVKFRHGRIMNFEATDIHRGLSFNKPHIPRISVKFLGEKNE
tara:strand:+ start:1124 stop:1669 length:546 start_codon:yes stop_codon:yes gene_type:complete